MINDSMEIAILMAVYEPNLVWLEKQLRSLNRQTYKNIVLYVRDDASASFSFSQLEQLLAETVTAFPYHCARNTENVGFNRTFSMLSEEAEADAFAYCDQDDIWAAEKLAVLADAIQRENAALAYCDLCVIDEGNRMIAKSISVVKPRIHPQAGEGLAPFFLVNNCVSGCAALVRAATVKQSLPFVYEMIYDQWLALHAALQGKIVFVPAPLVQHRLHSANQSETLKGILTKDDYINHYIHRDERRMKELFQRVSLPDDQIRVQAWMDARIALVKHEKGAWVRLFRLRDVKKTVSWFELTLPYMPGWLFAVTRKWIRREKA